MMSVQRAIFPGMVLGSIFIIFITGLISKPGTTLAHGLPADPLIQAVAGAAHDEVAPETVVSLEVVEHAASIEASAEQVEEETSQAGCSLNPAYPASIQQWCSLIERYAGENGLDPDLIASVMMQESAGNPEAYSKSGAVGLMQVMPRDGLAASFQCINGPCFASRPSMAELYDPEFNVQYGVNMLAGLIRKYGDLREGLRAYGPMNYGYRYADLILEIMARYE